LSAAANAAARSAVAPSQPGSGVPATSSSQSRARAIRASSPSPGAPYLARIVR
jgi:hypothetical protein